MKIFPPLPSAPCLFVGEYTEGGLHRPIASSLLSPFTNCKVTVIIYFAAVSRLLIMFLHYNLFTQFTHTWDTLLELVQHIVWHHIPGNGSGCVAWWCRCGYCKGTWVKSVLQAAQCSLPKIPHLRHSLNYLSLRICNSSLFTVIYTFPTVIIIIVIEKSMNLG